MLYKYFYPKIKRNKKEVTFCMKRMIPLQRVWPLPFLYCDIILFKINYISPP